MNTLRDFAMIIMGTAPPGNTYNIEGEGLPLIAGAGDYGQDHPAPKKWTTMPSSVAETGDLIICVRATIGDLNWADRPYCLGRGVAGIRVDKEKACSRYIAHYLHFKRHELAQLGTGSTFPAIRKADLEEFPLAPPALSEQQRIARVLDKAESIQRRRREASLLAKKLPLAFFREAFETKKDESSLVEPLNKVADVVSGVAKGRNFNGQEVLEVPYLRVANVQAGYLNLDEIKYIPATKSEVADLTLEYGDIVMTEGGDHDKLGRGALWDQNIPNCIHQNHIFRVRTKRDQILPSYFVHFLQTATAKAYFLKCAKKTSNLASINMRQLRALPVPVPSLKLQEQFDQEIQTVYRLIENQRVMEQESVTLFNALVQRAFCGEL